jgi:sulfite exporter TauE/SafE
MAELFDLLGSDPSGITPALLLTFGFTIGLLHATEADHVTAVATLVSRNKKISKASLLGALWGVGHTLALFLAGLAVMLLAVNIPERLSLTFEFGVGIMLVFLGLSVIGDVRNRLFRAWKMATSRHTHPHAHGGRIHVHPHTHGEEHAHGHKSIIIGMVHGLAGSGALMLVVLSTVDSVWNGLAYIALFGIGSIVGMLAISTAIGVPFALTAGRFDKMNRYIRVGASLLSIGLGISIMYEIGIVEKLFAV